MEVALLIQYVLVAILCVMAVVLVIGEIASLRAYTAAHRAFLHLLSQQAQPLRALYDQIMIDGVASSTELEQLVCSLERVAEGLSPRYRRVIAPLLRKHSERDRAGYASSVLKRAGICSGSLPIPTP
jgi:hypothetical protein